MRHKKTPIRIVTVATLALMIGSALPSHGFRLIRATSNGRITSGQAVACNNPPFLHWGAPPVFYRVYLNEANQGAGKKRQLKRATKQWNNIQPFNYTMQNNSTNAGFVTDGQHTVVFEVGNGCTGGCLALVALVVIQSQQKIVEADITFNNLQNWTTNGGQYDTRSVATHEFGHFGGIHHTEITGTPRPTMYPFYFGTGMRSLHADDIAAKQCIRGRYTQ